MEVDEFIGNRDSKIYQLKVTLDGIEPKIWRRFLVEDSVTFHELHRIIQRFMGWGNYHAYDFIVGDVCIGGEGDSPFCVDSMWRGFTTPVPSESATRTEFRDFIKKEKQKFRYVYDLGDNWVHPIVVEKILDKENKSYPILLGGERACPPEDCGGIYGYYELLEIRKDPSHPLYKERIVDWLGEDYDPEYFDIEEMNSFIRTDDVDTFSHSNHNRVKTQNLGRNDPCHCGSGKKYKKCCLPKDMAETGKPKKIPVS